MFVELYSEFYFVSTLISNKICFEPYNKSLLLKIISAI